MSTNGEWLTVIRDTGNPVILNKDLLKILGIGANYPWRFNKISSTEITNGLDKINDSIYAILATYPGERVNLPNFGSKLPALCFEMNTDELKSDLKFWTAEAIRTWEKRIILRDIQIADDPSFTDNNTINILITYELIKTMVIGVFTYPYVLQAMQI